MGKNEDQWAAMVAEIVELPLVIQWPLLAVVRAIIDRAGEPQCDLHWLERTLDEMYGYLEPVDNDILRDDMKEIRLNWHRVMYALRRIGELIGLA